MREAEAAGATAAGAVEIRKAFVEIKKPETGDPDNVMTAKRDRGRKEEKERAERKREGERQSPRCIATEDNTQQY